MDELVRCSICYHRYDENSRLPKSLPCGHTYCFSCITDPSQYRNCPEDDTPFDVSRCSTNEAIRRVSQIWAQTTDLPVEEPFHLPSAQPVPAVEFKPIPAMPALTCHVHHQEKIFFCRKERIAICPVCQHKHHHDHPYDLIEDVADQCRHRLRQHLVDLENRLFVVQSLKSEVETSYRQLTGHDMADSANALPQEIDFPVDDGDMNSCMPSAASAAPSSEHSPSHLTIDISHPPSPPSPPSAAVGMFSLSQVNDDDNEELSMCTEDEVDDKKSVTAPVLTEEPSVPIADSAVIESGGAGNDEDLAVIMKRNIENHFQRLHDLLDHRKQDLLKEVDGVCYKTAIALRNQTTDLEEYLQQGASILTENQSEVNSKPNYWLVENEDTVARRITAHIDKVSRWPKLQGPIANSDIEYKPSSTPSPAIPPGVSAIEHCITQVGMLQYEASLSTEESYIVETPPFSLTSGVGGQLTVMTCDTAGRPFIGNSTTVDFEILKVGPKSAIKRIRQSMHLPQSAASCNRKSFVVCNNDGTHTLKFVIPACGEYAFHVHINGTHWKTILCTVLCAYHQNPPSPTSSPTSLLTGTTNSSTLHKQPNYSSVYIHGDRLYAADDSNHCIHIFGLDGVFIKTFGSKGSESGQFRSPRGMCVHNETLYVCDTKNHRLQVFSLDGDFVVAGTSPLGIDFSPVALCIHNDALFVCDSFNRCISVYALNGGYIRSIRCNSTGTDQLLDPRAIVCSNDMLYICDANNGRTQVATLNGDFVTAYCGKKQTKLTPKPHYHVAICIEDDFVYICDSKNHCIHVIHTEGSFSRTIGKKGSGKGELFHPTGIAIHDNRIYVSDSKNCRIQVFMLDGTFVTTFSNKTSTKGKIFVSHSSPQLETYGSCTKHKL